MKTLQESAPTYRPKTQEELFSEMSAALFCLSTAPDEWGIPQEARETYKKLASSAFELIPPPSPPPLETCSCGYSLKAPGVGYWTRRGWMCKQCSEIHTATPTP
jgi:hypothetical protein